MLLLDQVRGMLVARVWALVDHLTNSGTRADLPGAFVVVFGAKETRNWIGEGVGESKAEWRIDGRRFRTE